MVLVLVYVPQKSGLQPIKRDNMKRLYEISQLKKPKKNPDMAFSFAVMLSQTVPKGKFDKVRNILRNTGHLENTKEGNTDFIKQRLEFARNWANKYAPEEFKIELRDKIYPETRKGLNNEQLSAVKDFAVELAKKDYREKELYDLFWEVAKKNGIGAPKLFQALYIILLGKERGPKLAPFILAVGKKKILNVLKPL